MKFTSLDISKKLHARGCKSVSGQFYSEHGIVHRHSPYEEYQDQKHEEIFGIPKYCLEDFALNNDHCRENWEKIFKNRANLLPCEYRILEMIDYPENSGSWCGYLEDLLKD